MAPHSSTLAWRIPWTEEPGRLQSMGSLRVGHGWATSLSLFTFMHWRRKWQPTPVFLPGESQGRGSLVGCRLWGCRVGHDWSDLAAAAAVAFFMLQSSHPCKISAINTDDFNINIQNMFTLSSHSFLAYQHQYLILHFGFAILSGESIIYCYLLVIFYFQHFKTKL